MSKRFGSGEFERTDIDVRGSALEMRQHFLKCLINYRPDVIWRLLAPGKLDGVEGVEQDQSFTNKLSFLLAAHAFGKWQPKEEIDPSRLATPFQYLADFVLKNQDRIGRFEKKVRNQRAYVSYQKAIALAVEELIPNWASISDDKSRKKICASITDWAEANGLREPWILEFALILLRTFVAHVYSLVRDLDVIDSTTVDDQFLETKGWAFYSRIRESCNDSSVDHYFTTISPRFLNPDIWPNLPPFEFKYGDFKMPGHRWFPTITCRKDFVADLNAAYRRFRSALIAFNESYEVVSEEGLVQQVRDYADQVERQRKAGMEESSIEPLEMGYDGQLVLHSAKWEVGVCREEFVKRYCSKLKREFTRMKKMARSIDKGTDESFDCELSLYCSKVERSMPTNYARTPAKHSDDKHFIWLMDFQIPPVRSYEQIANENTDITSTAVRRSVAQLAKQIGLDLRERRRTGRPVGVKEKERRRVASK